MRRERGPLMTGNMASQIMLLTLLVVCFNTLLLMWRPNTCPSQRQHPVESLAVVKSSAASTFYNFAGPVASNFTSEELDQIRLKRIGTISKGTLAVCAGYNEPDCRCGLVCKTIREKGFWAPTEATLFEHIWSITPKDSRVLVDVGANIGFFSVLSAGWGAQVSAFEPRPQPRSLLQLSVDVNNAHDRIRIFPYAVGAAEGEAKIAADQEWAIGQVQLASSGSKMQTRDADGTGASIAFQVVKLSSYVAGPITILKVDTEGFESSVFEGAFDLLDRVSYVIVEVKDFDKPEKRLLLHNILIRGNFKYAYNYLEQYASSVYPSVNNKFVDVTAPVRKQDLTTNFTWEDFVFSRKPVDPKLRIRPSA